MYVGMYVCMYVAMYVCMYVCAYYPSRFRCPDFSASVSTLHTGTVGISVMAIAGKICHSVSTLHTGTVDISVMAIAGMIVRDGQLA